MVTVPLAAKRVRQPSDLIGLDPHAHGKKTWIRPDGRMDGSSSTLNSDIVNVEKTSQGSNSSNLFNGSLASKGPDDISLPDLGNKLGDSSTVPPVPLVHTFDFATKHTESPRGRRQSSQQRSPMDKAGITSSPRPTSQWRRKSSNTPSHMYSPSREQAPKGPVLHHADYRSYQRSGEDQVLGDIGGLLSSPNTKLAFKATPLSPRSKVVSKFGES